MKVLILPGGTSPYGKSKKHCDSYTDILRAIRSVNAQAEVSVVTYPGQRNVEGIQIGELTYLSSLQAVQKEVAKGQGKDIRLVCVCWGCQIGAAICALGDKTVKKTLFWAPVPFWKLYETCVLSDKLWAGQEEVRGVKVTPRTMDGITPFEFSLQKITDTSCCVAAGTYDEYVTSSALCYFESLIPQKDNFRFHNITGCSHMVNKTDPGWVTFESLILRWLLE